MYEELAPNLLLVADDVVAHLRGAPGSYNALCSVFGAIDFTDPQELLPAAAQSLRPGGRLVLSPLAHYLTGAPADPAVVAADVPAKAPDCQRAVMQRWVMAVPGSVRCERVR
ncbi:hypothetical protein [Streptomyces sp. NPDC059918]|uniref:hypothetical protein n=1 Tax=unclassified Streptomyces TaxID=2593676 RepID=UPI0036635C22